MFQGLREALSFKAKAWRNCSMRTITKALVSMAAFFAPAALPQAATLGGFDYAIQYDYREFYSIADNRPFQVIIVGNPFPGQPIAEVSRRMLPMMQAGKP